MHRFACKLCGFDFGIRFGEEFSGKIEVHHIKSISEIGEECVVDPVRDLVSVCPNCHMRLTLWRIASALDMRMSELMRLVEDEIDRMNHVTKP